MSSGLAVQEKCVDAFKDLNKRVYGAIVLKVNDGMTEVCLEKTFEPNDVDPKSEWEAITKTLPDTDCRFILTDFKWKETPTVTSSKIILVQWSPEDSPVKPKMIYASSKESVTSKMNVQRYIQATEKDEITYEAILKNVSK